MVAGRAAGATGMEGPPCSRTPSAGSSRSCSSISRYRSSTASRRTWECNSGFHEANPLLAWSFGYLGTAPALVLFKLHACACLLVLWRLRGSRLAVPALGLSAVVYAVCSFAPWTAALASAHIAYLAS